MQQGHCACGHLVLVACVMARKGVRHMSRPMARTRRLTRCPSCGRQIDIHELR